MEITEEELKTDKFGSGILSINKFRELQTYLITRFNELERMRKPFDTDITKEVELFNNKDDTLDNKPFWQDRVQEPFLYTLGQTMTAKLTSSLFAHTNFLKMYVEDDKFYEKETAITKWFQSELDKIKFKAKSRDWIESSLTRRTSWLALRPTPLKKDKEALFPEWRMDFDIYDWFDVWFDTRQESTFNTDFFVRKHRKLFELKRDTDLYGNLDDVGPWDRHASATMADENRANSAKNASSINGANRTQSQSTQMTHPSVDEVELMEYYGVFNIADGDPNNPDFKPNVVELICTIANRTNLIRVEKNKLTTKRKRLIFPMRPLKQAESLIGKSIGQLVGQQQRELNEMQSLQFQNYKQQVKLLFKYNKNADLDLDEFFAGAGNAIGFDGDADDVGTFETKNVLNESFAMIRTKKQDMQLVLGAVDAAMGQGGSGSDTAAGERQAVEQANFKFSMMADNCYDDCLEFMNFLLILLVQFNHESLKLRHPDLVDFFDAIRASIFDAESSYIIDIEMKDHSNRRDVEMNQWANLANILLPTLPQIGGNPKELVRQLMEVFNMRNIDKLLKPEDPNALIQFFANNPQLFQQVFEGLQQLNAQKQQGGAAGQAPAPAVPGGTAVEKAANENVQT